MKVSSFVLAALVAPLSAFATSPLTVGSSEWNMGRVTVNYTLSRSAVVTFDVLTNGVPIAGEWTASGWKGDAFKLLPAGDYTIVWKARHKDLSDIIVDGNVAKLRVKAWDVDEPPPYAVVELSGGFPISYYEKADQIPDGVTSDTYKTGKLVLRRIPAAGETVGMPSVDDGTRENALVSFARDFYLGVYPLTHAQQSRMTGASLSSDKGPYRGSWNGIRGDWSVGTEVWPASGREPKGGFLKTIVETTGLAFDLPTYAEWNFAARGGTTDLPADIGEYAWYQASMVAAGRYDAANKTYSIPAVGQKKPNGYGLYDVYGLVWEWVLDYPWQDDSFKLVKPSGHLTDPVGSSTPALASNFQWRWRCGGGYDTSTVSYLSYFGARRNAVHYSNDYVSGANGSCNPNQGLRLYLPCRAVR